MSAMASQITGVFFLTQPFVQARIKKNIKAPRHWPLEGNPPVTGGFPSQRASNATCDAIMVTPLTNLTTEDLCRWILKQNKLVKPFTSSFSAHLSDTSLNELLKSRLCPKIYPTKCDCVQRRVVPGRPLADPMQQNHRWFLTGYTSPMNKVGRNIVPNYINLHVWPRLGKFWACGKLGVLMG